MFLFDFFYVARGDPSFSIIIIIIIIIFYIFRCFYFLAIIVWWGNVESGCTKSRIIFRSSLKVENHVTFFLRYFFFLLDLLEVLALF